MKRNHPILKAILSTLVVLFLVSGCMPASQIEPTLPASQAPLPSATQTPAPSATPAAQTLLAWQSDACEVFTVTPGQASYGACNADQTAVAITPEQMETLSGWMETYAAFNADTPAGTVAFKGEGQLTATDSEKRMIAEWARLAFEAAQSGRSGAAWGLALSWKREGGLAGFCDEAAVYLDGSVIVSSCKAAPEPYPTFRLNATQLEQMYAWVDTYAIVEQINSDEAIADAMTVQLYLYGLGTSQPVEETRLAMQLFVSDLTAQAVFNQDAGQQLESALGVLRQFYELLNIGAYAAAVPLYGGSWEPLTGWNPGLENDPTALLENGCTVNGLQCLQVRSAVYRGPDVRGGDKFWLEFMNPDGTLFKQGPCCGDESGASVSIFLVSVIEHESRWLVMDLPPYLP